MIDLLLKVVKDMAQEDAKIKLRIKKIDVQMNLLSTFYRLNLVSSTELKHAKLSAIMAKHLEKFSR